MKNRHRVRKIGQLGCAVMVLWSVLVACTTRSLSFQDEEEVAKHLAVSLFSKEKNCTDGTASVLHVETHFHPRWIGRESSRIYDFAVEGCSTKNEIRVTCSEEVGCRAA